MRRYALRLAAALAAFAAGVSVPAPHANPGRAPAQTQEAAAAPALPANDAGRTGVAPPAATPAQAEAPAAETVRIGQRETVVMPGVGRVRVTAFETDDRDAQLVFEDIDSDEELLRISMANGAMDPLLRFRVMRVKGLPGPVVVGVAVAPGGSDATYQLAAVAPVNGELKELTKADEFTTAEEGGFYIGDLGRGVGLGVAVWQFVWGSDESHVAPHRYEIKLYKWGGEGARFERARTFRTPGKFDDGAKALRSVGLRFNDLRATIPEFKYLDGED